MVTKEVILAESERLRKRRTILGVPARPAANVMPGAAAIRTLPDYRISSISRTSSMSFSVMPPESWVVVEISAYPQPILTSG
jgi:hypothetical protein